MGKERDRRIQYYIRWTSGLLASGVLVYLSFLSVRQNYTLETPVILGLLALITILLYGADALEGIIEAWRRTNGN